jgi:YhcH/YjgK/YiaL family protein
MVKDHIRNADAYRSLGPGIAKALDYLKKTDFTKVATGKHQLGEGVYAVVQQYETGPQEEKQWEAHRRYIDIQYIAAGEECIGCVDIESLVPLSEYNADKDEMFLEGTGEFTGLGRGNFMILQPHEAHMPKVAREGKCEVHKVVVKVPV